jgi:DNA-binding PadR family transcriptional regulator
VVTRLLVLWLLAERPLHGYRIKRILEDDALAFWFPIEFASIYSVLRTLERHGYVTSLAVEQEGARPQRTKYAITAAGRRYLVELLEQSWRALPPPGAAVDAALAARPELAPEQLPALVRERADALRARLALLDRVGAGAPSGELLTRQRILVEAELRWASDFLARLESGE